MTEETENINTVKAYSGALEVIGNGTVHVTENYPLNLKLGTDLEMGFEFITDKNEKEFKISRRIDEKNKLVWVLTNFSNSLGTGVVVPMRLGALYDRSLHFSFFIWTPSSEVNKRIVNYVVYLGETVAKEEGEENE